MTTSKTSAKDFIDFWNWTAQKGELKPNTAHTMKISSAEVLKCSDNWETLDIRTLDIETAFRRFVNKRGKDFKPASLQSYKARFKRGIAMFLEYSNDPSSWKPSLKTRDKAQKHNSRTTQIRQPPLVQEPEIQEEKIEALKIGEPNVSISLPSITTAPFIEYPFPLREGRPAYLKLPTDLKTLEVKRLIAFLQALTIDAELITN